VSGSEPRPDIAFRPLSEADLPTLARWMERPHVARVWARDTSLEALRERYLPRIAGDSPVRPYVALLDGRPLGYVQSYVAAEVGDGWWPEEDDPGVRGIDFFLADADRLGRGLGSAMVRAFVERLFQDPTVTRVQADPAPDNGRSIRCLEKAGFRRSGPVTTPDGPAILMVVEPPDTLVHR